MHIQYLHGYTGELLVPVAQSVESPLRESWGHGFDTGPRHTEVFKYGTSCSSLSTQTSVEKIRLVEAVSG